LRYQRLGSAAAGVVQQRASATSGDAWRLVLSELAPPLLDEYADTLTYSLRDMLELGEAALT